MRLNRFNEATFLNDGTILYSKEEVLNLKLFKAVYSDLIEDVKEYLDTIFVEFSDKDYLCSITKVNRRDTTFFTRYRVSMSYQLEKVKNSKKLKTRSVPGNEPKFNTIENYSEVMKKVSEDLLDLNNCVMHIKDEYSTDSIYGEPFGKNEFETSVNMQMSSGELTVEFVLDIK